MGVALYRAAGGGNEGKDVGEFPDATGVSAVLESVVVSFGCAGAGPAASSGHGWPPMVGEGWVGLWVGEVMEGPGRLRRMSATPVAMRGVRPWGRFTSATTLRQPRTSEGMWKRREEISLWGALDHQKCPAIVPMGVVRLSGGLILRGGCSTSVTALGQPRTSERTWRRRAMVSRWGSLLHQKCSTIPRDRSGDPRPAFVDRSFPMVTTVESKKGALVLSRRSSDCPDSPARSMPGESEKGAEAQGGAMAQGSTMTLCSGASPEGAKPKRRVSGARTWQWPLERECGDLSGDLPCWGRDGD